MNNEIKLFAEYRNKELMKKELAKWAFYEIPKLNENSQIAISYRELLLVISGAIDETRADQTKKILKELEEIRDAYDGSGTDNTKLQSIWSKTSPP